MLKEGCVAGGRGAGFAKGPECEWGRPVTLRAAEKVLRVTVLDVLSLCMCAVVCVSFCVVCVSCGSRCVCVCCCVWRVKACDVDGVFICFRLFVFA